MEYDARITSAFAAPTERLEWVEGALKEMDQCLREFFIDNKTVYRTDFDPDTGESIYIASLPANIPSLAARKATEVINLVKETFDQCISSAQKSLGHPNFRDRKIGFPWGTDATQVEANIRQKGIDERFREVIFSHNPHFVGDDRNSADNYIRNIAQLANVKHTVGLAVRGDIESVTTPSIHIKSAKSFKILIPRWSFDKNEAELIRYIGDIDIKNKYKIIYTVIFSDTKFIQPVNAMKGLLFFAQLANSLNESLKIKCAEILQADHL
ncbi:hypothetical protein [Gluconobacter sp. Dm-44]|uniref:hypothetical protein n=1 Tax=Gluconobacter sp. Dm-44 TaxID=2799805 RepID=UPI001B8D48BD|nr:hypothetical protein [Gluconobacter sp. Dm-44]MBS1060771.1 hypothetical protein [Gluconobacter sp. Dm-44]